MEKWIPAKGFSKYEVSNLGNIRNVKTGRVMRTNVNEHGYIQTCIRDDEKRQHTIRVHRLIADSFYDGDHSGLDVNHIDGNKLNNRIGNLEYCTRQENIRHAFDTGLKEPSRQIKVRVVETGKVYKSIRECARDINVDQTTICQYLLGRIKTCKGYHFEKVV